MSAARAKRSSASETIPRRGTFCELPKPSTVTGWLRLAFTSFKPQGPVAPPKGFRSHPSWEKLPNALKLRQLHYALARMPVEDGFKNVAFSLNLDYEIERLAIESGDPLDYLFRALNRHLDDAGLESRLLVVAEHAKITDFAEQAKRAALALPPDRRLHLHGDAAMPPASFPDVLSAFCGAAGPWRPSLRIRECRSTTALATVGTKGGAGLFQLAWSAGPRGDGPDAGWIRYITKETSRIKVTAAVRTAAMARYAEHRTHDNEKLRRKRMVAAKLSRTQKRAKIRKAARESK